MTSSRAVPGPSPRWLVEAGLAGRPSFAIAPLLACGGAAVVAALRIAGHPAGPFAASLVEGVLPLGVAIAVARLIGTDPADYVDADDLVRLLGDAFTIERHAVEPRLNPPPDTPHTGDVILRARRR